MHVNLARADLAAAWHSDTGFTEAPDERPEDGNARAHLRDEFVRSLVFIDGGRVDGQRMVGAAFDIGTEMGKDFVINEGDGAFYGPKLDIQYKNVYGKEDTLVTIQIDMLLAERFGMYYIDENGEKKLPYIIHRTSLGCYERTLAYLIEEYAGALPTWMAPEQVRFLPVTDRAADYCAEQAKKLEDMGFRVEVDYRNEKIGRKIRDAQMEKVPYMVVVGDRDMENGTVSPRHRADGDLGAMSMDEFSALLKQVVDNKEKK